MPAVSFQNHSNQFEIKDKQWHWKCVMCVFLERSIIMIAGTRKIHFALYIKYVNAVWLRQSEASIEVDS